MSSYDVIVIGGGHNGLTAAAYLARARKRVLVLERRSILGGALTSEPLVGGLDVDAVWPGGHLRPGIVKDLGLAAFGYPGSASPAPFIALLAGSDRLTLDPDPAGAADSIRRFSEKDARRWPEFVEFMNRAAAFLDAAYATIMPRLPRGFSLRDGYGLLELGLDLRLTGRKHMMPLVRALAMSAQEIVEDWFESEPLRAAVASLGIYGITRGPMAAGTGLMLIHNWLNRGGLAHTNVGRAGAITQSLAAAVRAKGGEVRTDAEVERIRIESLACRGVDLAGGESISAAAVLSALDPHRTFLSLVGARHLPPEFVWKVQSIKLRGSVAKIHLQTDGRHGLPDGTLVVAPSIRYLERACDEAKYGGISGQPYLEVTTFGSAVSIHLQYAPYHLKGTSWNDQRSLVENLAINTLAGHFPELAASVISRRTLTPADLESLYGLTEGDLNHGQLQLDQALFMRPIPGWSNHKTPIDRLFLSGSGVHGGGGISGASGRNAAHVILHP